MTLVLLLLVALIVSTVTSGGSSTVTGGPDKEGADAVFSLFGAPATGKALVMM